MTDTIYSIHRAEDDEIVGFAGVDTVRASANSIAQSLATAAVGERRHAYAHNGLAVVSAGRCESDGWHDVDRADFAARDEIAREKRAERGLTNDQRR